MMQRMDRQHHKLTFWRLAWASALSILLIHSSALALPPQVAQLLSRAKKSFRPITKSELQRAKQEVRASADELEAFLLAGGTAENARRWKDYLNWESMLEQLDQAKPDLRAIQRSTSKFYQHEGGLHLPQFTRLRDALTVYLSLEALSRHPDLKSEYGKQLDTLESGLKSLEKTPDDPKSADQVASSLGWLNRVQRQAKLVAAVRRHYFHDNLQAHVSARLVTAGINEPVRETIDISDNIMGTSIWGTAETTGQVSATLLPARDHARIQLSLEAEAASDNVGQNRGVTIWSTGLTTLAATKEIHFGTDGFSDQPADAEAATSTNVYALSARSCFIEKLAWRRVGKTKGQAEIVASQHAAGRLAQQMDERVDEMLADPKSSYNERFREPLLRRGQWPSVFHVSSTPKNVVLKMLQANVAQASAAVAAPKVDESRDLDVRLHETFVSNFSRAMIGGVTLTDERLEEILEKSGGEVPDELKTSSDKPPWSITFSSTKPVSATFREGRVRFAIFGRRFSQGGNVVESPIRLSASYSIERTPQGAKLTRQGDVVVEFTRLKRLGPTQIALRTVMRAKFEALFKPEFNTEGIQLPGRWKDAGILKLAHISPQSGWLSVGWILEPKHDPAPKTASVAQAR